MKLLKKYIPFIFIGGQVLLSCKKDVEPVQLSSITIVNSVIGSNPIITDFSSTKPISIYYASTPKISYGAFYSFSRPNGNLTLTAYQTTDTTNAIYNTDNKGADLNLQPQGIYSLFLCGQVMPTVQPDAVFVKDDLPYHPSNDSTVGVRFINLSPGSNPLNVTLSTSTTTNEFAGIAYKSITSFKNYAATAAVSSYVFQFRDAMSNAVLGSFTISGVNNGTGTNTLGNTYRFRNFTVVFKGLPGATGTNAQGTFIVNNY
ncbi:MAG: hypothetical protein V4539_09915 [Bacteroidota bacterium]